MGITFDLTRERATMFRNNIRNKLTLFLLAATLIPMLVSMLISSHSIKHAVTKRAIYENTNLLKLGASNLHHYMDTYNRISLTVYNGINRPRSLFTVLEQASSADSDLQGPATGGDTIYNHLLNMMNSVKDISQIHLYIHEWRQSNLVFNGYFRRMQNFRFSVPAGAPSGNRAYVEPPHVIHRYGLSVNFPAAKSVPETVLTFHRPIIKTPADQIMGYLSIDFRPGELDLIARQLFNPSEEKLYVVDHQGNVIYSPDSRELGQSLAWDWSGLIQGDSGSFEWKTDDFAGIMIYDKIKTDYMEWTILKQIPYRYLYAYADTVTRINTFILVATLVVVVIATTFISFWFTKPIKQLIRAIHHIQLGKWNVAIDLRRKDEIGVLADRFNAMIGTIRELITREYRLEIANKTNQLKALQAQINPHFLYNALQSIGTLALQHNVSRIYSLISALGRMMRYNMDTRETVVPLSKEFDYVRSYLALQKQRFNDRLRIRWSVDESSASVRVLKMILQPLVENYFKHGFNTQQQAGEIRIASRVADRQLMLAVEDNGTGMPEDRLRRLQMRLNRISLQRMDEFETIGLANTLARLKLHFGEEAGMRLSAVHPHGLRVELIIPLSNEQPTLTAGG